MPGEKILVIEDSPEFLGVLAEDVLPLHGYEVLTATTGREGLSKLSSESPDLVLLDLELPDVSGMEILRSVEEAGSITPIILMTAYGSESIAVEAFRLEAGGHIIKPFTFEQVTGVLERAFTEERLRREKEQLTVLSAVGKSAVSLMAFASATSTGEVGSHRGSDTFSFPCMDHGPAHVISTWARFPLQSRSSSKKTSLFVWVRPLHLPFRFPSTSICAGDLSSSWLIAVAMPCWSSSMSRRRWSFSCAGTSSSSRIAAVPGRGE